LALQLGPALAQLAAASNPGAATSPRPRLGSGYRQVADPDQTREIGQIPALSDQLTGVTIVLLTGL
jgi:hypothetical protein